MVERARYQNIHTFPDGNQGKSKRVAADVEVKKGYSDEEKLGIAIALLMEQGKLQLVEWIRTVRDQDHCNMAFDRSLRIARL
jgi:hypothetical protein